MQGNGFPVVLRLCDVILRLRISLAGALICTMKSPARIHDQEQAYNIQAAISQPLRIALT